MSQKNFDPTTTSPAASAEKVETPGEKKIVVGVWLRLVSDGLDALFLGLFGYLLILLFREPLSMLGQHGIWIGLFIAFLYTGILQSAVGQGQSLGKKLLKIQVLRTDGEYMSLPLSFLRYMIIALLFYHSWIYMALPFLANHPIFQLIYNAFIFALFIGCVLMVAFHPAKRGIHDLVAGTVVVRKGMYDRSKIDELIHNKSQTQKAFLIVGICSVLSLVGAGTLSYQTVGSKLDLGPDWQVVREQIMRNTEFQNVWGQSMSVPLKDKKLTMVVVSVNVKKAKFDDKKGLKLDVQTAVGTIVKNYETLKADDTIFFNVTSGVHIGIAASMPVRSYLFSGEGKQKGEEHTLQPWL